MSQKNIFEQIGMVNVKILAAKNLVAMDFGISSGIFLFSLYSFLFFLFFLLCIISILVILISLFLINIFFSNK